MQAPSLPFLPVKTVNQRSTSSMSYTVVTGSGTIHTKGAYTTIVAATPFDVEYMVLTVGGTQTAATDTRALFDLAIGAAASEVVILSNLNIGFTSVLFTNETPGRQIILPLRIPAGVRIAGRLQGLIASDTVNVNIDLFGGSPFPMLSGFAACDTYGADTANSRGTTVSSGNVTKGAWAELTASTTRQVDGLFLAAGLHSGTVIVGRNNIIDIGAGAGGSEVVIVPDVPFSFGSNESLSSMPRDSMITHLNLPAGTRLAARAAGSAAAVNIDVIAYGLRR